MKTETVALLKIISQWTNKKSEVVLRCIFFCAPCVLVTLRYGAGIIFGGVRRFAQIAALTRFSHFRQHPKWQLPMRAARTITIQSARNWLSVSLVSITQQLSLARSLKTTPPPRRAAESTMRRHSLCQAQPHQHRKHAIIFICLLSAAHSPTYTNIWSRYALAGKKWIERFIRSDWSSGGGESTFWYSVGGARLSLGRADAPLALVDSTHIHTCFLLSRPCTRFLMINDAQAWCWCRWQATTTHPRLCFLSSSNNGPESFSQHAAFLFEYCPSACVL